MLHHIKVNEDIRLTLLNSKLKQQKVMLDLLTKNKLRLVQYFPGLYQKPLSMKEIYKILKQKEKSFKNKEVTSYAICSRKNKRIIGEINIYHTLIDAHISYWIDKEAEGKGIVSQVFDVLRDHLFQKDISAIYASCDKTNTRSIDFLKSKGLQEVATYNSTYQRHFVDLMQTKRDYLFYKRLEQNQKGRE